MAILALDAGTSSIRAMVFGDHGEILSRAQQPFEQHFPRDGWVEHDAVEIWSVTIRCAQDAIHAAGISANALAGIGIAVQRETVVIWDRNTGQPIHRAIVWQDRRTAEECERLASIPEAQELVATTGLLLDPYFSATKIAWLLDNVSGARAAAEQGTLLAGTIDTWLLWKLTGGKTFATDATNASRTLLFDITKREWSSELCTLFNVPMQMLAEVRDSASEFGTTTPDLFGSPIPIRAILGDQQAGALGQNCVAVGNAKVTYGTGCFALVNTGATPLVSKHRLLTTIAWQLDGVATYALEGSIFNAGTIVQWMRDKLGFIAAAAESEAVASSVESSSGVYCIPAFTGLGAPWWKPHARAALVGMTRDTGRAEIVRAGLESVALQTRDLMNAFADDGVVIDTLRVDGGMAENNWLMQAVSDQVQRPVERSAIIETTAWGAARLAGLHAGLYPELSEDSFRRVEQVFVPGNAASANELHAGWLTALGRIVDENPHDKQA